VLLLPLLLLLPELPMFSCLTLHLFLWFSNIRCSQGLQWQDDAASRAAAAAVDPGAAFAAAAATWEAPTLSI
jgi:hypothetical protein